MGDPNGRAGVLILLYCNILAIILNSMCEKEERPAQEKELRNLIRSLSKVSEKETREIRETIAKERQLKNGNRIKYDV